jgi:hypothetical protein
MEELRDVMEIYDGWSYLKEHVRRIESYQETDVRLAIENCKALLESIGKEICKRREKPVPEKKIPMSKILSQAFNALGFDRKRPIKTISTALATIGQEFGSLRNLIGDTSHGKTKEQLKSSESIIDDLTTKFLIQTTESVACFLIKSYEGLNTRSFEEEKLLEYDKCKDFNDYWDKFFEQNNKVREVNVGGEYSFAASEILFFLDRKAYSSEYNQFKRERRNDQTQ